VPLCWTKWCSGAEYETPADFGNELSKFGANNKLLEIIIQNDRIYVMSTAQRVGAWVYYTEFIRDRERVSIVSNLQIV